MTSTARDIKFFYNPLVQGDYADVKIDYGDLVLDGGFETLILISLFTDAYVDKNSSYNGESRGWFGNEILGFNLGSKLWQLDRSKINKETLNLATQYSKDALQWMVGEGMFKSVETLALKSTSRRNAIDLYIAVYKPDGTIDKYKYNVQWIAQTGSG